MGQRYTSISDLYKQVKLNESEIIERKLTSQELEDREKIAKKLPMDDFKKRYGKDAMAVKMATATNIVKKKSQNEEVGLDEAKYEVQYTVGSRVGDSRSKSKSRLSKIDIDARSKEDAENKFFKQAEKSPMMKDAMRRDMLDVVYVGLKETMEDELGEKYNLYHSTFSGAMQHAYDHAKKKMGITVDKREIDSKVATGPKKPSEGKTNKYRLKGKGGNLQIQVFNKGGSKPFELNMYKEEVELDEKFTKKDFAKNEGENQHTKNAIELVKMFGTSAEDIKINAIAARHNMKGSIDRKDQQVRDALVKKYYPKLKEEVEINEDGHQDVASAIRQCKTITEDAMQIMSKLQSMSPEDSLPTWWTNKLAVASNSMNKMRDYLLVPSVQEKYDSDKFFSGKGTPEQRTQLLKLQNKALKAFPSSPKQKEIKKEIDALRKKMGMKVSEEVEINEKAGDTNDMKKLVGELQNASKMHLAQSKRVRAHLNMMKPGNLRGTVEIAPIINELEKASEAHKRQSKIIAKHMEAMTEELNKDDVKTIKNVVKGLKGAVKAHTGQAKELEKAMNEQPEHEITVGNYTTKHFYMCGSAQKTMKKHADKDGAEELTRMQDVFYKMEKDAMDAGSANDEQKKKSQILYDKIMAKAKEVGIADEVGKYMKMHLDSMLKGNPKLGFGRTDIKESYQDMIARIMSQRSMR